MGKTYIHNYETLESMSQAVWYNRWTLSKFAPYLRGDILEVGCGIGNFTKTLTSYGHVTAFDNDRDCIARTKKHVGGEASVGFGDIEQKRYHFGKKKFDSIVCLNVLEHIHDDRSSIRNMADLLKQFGILVLLVPVHEFLYGEIDRSIHHYRRYNKDGILRLVTDAGLTIESSRTLNFFGALGWFFSGKILRSKTVKKQQLSWFNSVAPYLLPLENIIEPPIGTSMLLIARKTR